jgi:protein tyrosine phosphatase (PTP) superfamily phosphohydrolase (DUF442 family)
MKDLYNYLYWNEKLSSSGMPKPEQLKSVADAGVQTVINLATAKSEGAIPNEDELVRNLGMKYIHIPVDWNNPTKQELDDFMRAMEEHENEHILVHCQANYRATAFVAMDGVLRQGWSADDALEGMHKVWHEEENPIWAMFIEDMLNSQKHEG